MYINDMLKDIVLYMFDFLLRLIDFCVHFFYQGSNERILEKKLLFQKLSRSIGMELQKGSQDWPSGGFDEESKHLFSPSIYFGWGGRK